MHILLRAAMGAAMLVVTCGAADDQAAAVNRDDLRCLAVAAAAAASDDQQVVAHATIAVMYWMGRLEGRNPDMDIERALTTTANQMTDDDVRVETQRCSQALTARGNFLIEMGKHMSAHANDHNL